MKNCSAKLNAASLGIPTVSAISCEHISAATCPAMRGCVAQALVTNVGGNSS